MEHTPQLVIPFRQDIASLFPNHGEHTGGMTLPHDIPTTTILRKLGFVVPAPVLSQYKWTGTRTPFDVQKTTVEMLTMNQRAYVLSGMGVGKTACPLWALDFLKKQKQASKMLVVAPLSTLHFVWMREIFAIDVPLSGVVLHGSRAKRLKLLAEDHDVYIINHDGIGTIYDELIKRPDIDVLCIDELAVYRNPGERTKLMKKLAARFKWAWGMTGGPAPNQPTDVWNQANILTPDTVPKYFGKFRDDLMVKINNFKYVPRMGAIEKAYDALQPSVRFTLEDVRELPPYISRRIDVALGIKQKHVYETIRKQGLAMLGGDTISAANKGVLLSKLLQISLGYVYSEKKGVITLDNDARLKALLDILDAGPGQMLVFTGYKHALHGINEAVTRGGWNSAMVSGDTPLKERGQIFTDFQTHGLYKTIVAHPQCVSHGLTLTAADTVVWFGPIPSLETYDQANARIRRTGQTKKQQFIHLQATPAEKKLYDALINKQNIQNALLSMFEDE